MRKGLYFMTYQFKSDVKALDLWILTMRRTYRSMAGICNLVFTVAMILLTVKFWEQSGDVLQVILLFACLLFPVIQPIGIYLKAKGQTRALPKDMELQFDEGGLHVTVGTGHEDIQWNQIRAVKELNMIIIFSGARHGYMLTNRVLGEEKEAFFAFVTSKIKQGK